MFWGGKDQCAVGFMRVVEDMDFGCWPIVVVSKATGLCGFRGFSF